MLVKIPTRIELTGHNGRGARARIDASHRDRSPDYARALDLETGYAREATGMSTTANTPETDAASESAFNRLLEGRPLIVASNRGPVTFTL